MKTKQELVYRIDEIVDEIVCAEQEEEIDGDTSIDVDSLQCELADLRNELKERFPNHQGKCR